MKERKKKRGTEKDLKEEKKGRRERNKNVRKKEGETTDTP